MYSEAFEDVREEKSSYFGHVDGFGAWNDNYPLHKAVVDHDQNGVHPAYFQEVCNKVHRELFKREGCCGSDGVQWRANRVCIHFVLLAYGASFNELVNVSSQAWPPEVTFKESLGMESTCMPKGGRGMKGGYKGMAGVRWNVHPPFVIEMTSFICPIFYGGAREQRGVSVQVFNCL